MWSAAVKGIVSPCLRFAWAVRDSFPPFGMFLKNSRGSLCSSVMNSTGTVSDQVSPQGFALCLMLAGVLTGMPLLMKLEILSP